MTNYSEKFEKMRIAGKLAAKTLDMLTENIKEGVSTDYIDKLGYEFIMAYPKSKKYPEYMLEKVDQSLPLKPNMMLKTHVGVIL